jgi:GntR family transcriptional regulator, transcriptional repressor for pyruvate dehydrogenase complex
LNGESPEALTGLVDRPLRRRNVADEVIELLQRLVLDGRFAPGERLPPQRQLAEALGVGLSSVREAIKALVGAQLLQVRPGSGTYVTDLARATLLPLSADAPTGGALRDLVEVRRALEHIAVRGFVTRATQADVAELRAVMAAMRAAADDPEELARRDAELHLQVARGAHNVPALQALQSLTPLLETELRHNADLAASSVGDLEFAIRSHELLVEALTGGDIDEALNRLEDVLRRAAFYAEAGVDGGQPEARSSGAEAGP